MYIYLHHEFARNGASPTFPDETQYDFSPQTPRNAKKFRVKNARLSFLERKAPVRLCVQEKEKHNVETPFKNLLQSHNTRAAEIHT
jgi:hypothetical protein